MAAKAALVDFLAGGLIGSAGEPLSGYQVRTYAADGSTAKAVWEDRDKSLPSAAGKSSFTLDATGRTQVYADSIYVFKIWEDTADPDVDNPYLTVGPVSFQDAATTGSYTVVVKDASAGQVFVDVVAASDSTATGIIVIKSINDTSSNAVTFRPASGTVEGAATVDLVVTGEAALFLPSADEDNYYRR